MPAFAFPRTARLLQRKEFVAVRDGGRSFADGPLAASYMSRPRSLPAGSPPGGARVGLTVSSKVGSAVVRNRIKRRLREAVRHELLTLPPVDLVLVARQSAARASVAEFRTWLQRASARIRKGSV